MNIINNCKKCTKKDIADNEKYNVFYCKSCNKFEIFIKKYNDKIEISCEYLKNLIQLDYTINYVIYDLLRHYRDIKADNYFIEICKFIEKEIKNG